jgi:hypothetical protein
MVCAHFSNLDSSTPRFVRSRTLAFSTAADVVSPNRIGTSAAIVNGFMFLVSGIMIQRLGVRVGWNLKAGVERGTLELAQYAAWPLMLALFIALALAFLVRETYPTSSARSEMITKIGVSDDDCRG